ncbi:MAG: hypothetical protein KatS3mg116_2940 [Elioraea sp.]|nr:MAG: hypothetical protein KatS3mg116_2940 [Elioraea sp.]
MARITLSPITITLAAEGGAAVDLDAELIRRAREGMASLADLAALRAELLAAIAAGVNVSVAADQGRVLISAIGSPASYATVDGDRDLRADDNGRVLEVVGDGAVVTLVPGLRRGHSCVLRQVGDGPAVVRRGRGVRIEPVDADLQTSGRWQEIAVECIAGDASSSTATYLVRLIPA